jgi:xanthine dehydrogenase YagR molybdenum-binding subunit
VKKIVAVHDCGIPLNRLTLESQTNGGIIQGSGSASWKSALPTRRPAAWSTRNLEEYKIPGCGRCPSST